VSRTRGFAVALAIATTFAWTSTASAFCRSTTCKPKKETCDIDEAGCVTSGVPVRWEKLPIPFRFHSRGSTQLVREETRASVRAAFHRWSDVTCPDGRRTSLRFDELEDTYEDKPLEPDSKGAEPFGVYFRDLGWPYVDQDETLAKTNTIYRKTSGRIDYADIEVNSTKPFALTETAEATDLQAVLTHEVGHYIGLAHSREPQSIMAESYCDRDDRCEKGKVAARRLAEDDIRAVCTLYPPEGTAAPSSEGGETAQPAEEEKTGCSAAPSAASRAGAPLGAALVIIAALLRRVRASRPSARSRWSARSSCRR
jgi:hypothetical protein